MRQRYIQDRHTGKLIPADEYFDTHSEINAPSVLADMQAYRSPLDGSIVDGRAAHRQHMRKHGVIEVGNEKLTQRATKSIDDNRHRESLRKDIAKTLSGYGI